MLERVLELLHEPDPRFVALGCPDCLRPELPSLVPVPPHTLEILLTAGADINSEAFASMAYEPEPPVMAHLTWPASLLLQAGAETSGAWRYDDIERLLITKAFDTGPEPDTVELLLKYGAPQTLDVAVDAEDTYEYKERSFCVFKDVLPSMTGNPEYSMQLLRPLLRYPMPLARCCRELCTISWRSKFLNPKDEESLEEMILL